MMRIAYISDVHGNLQSLEATLEDMQKHRVDKVVMLGDMVGDGPNPAEVVEIAKKECFKSVLGNREVYCLDYLDGTRKYMEEYKQFAPAVWTAKQLNASNLEYIKSLPVSDEYCVGSSKHFIIHASPRGYRDLVFKDDKNSLNEIVPKIDCNVYAYGHTHQPWIGKVKDVLVINPGSLGLSLCEMGYTQYIIVTYDKQGAFAEIKKVRYDAQSFVEGIKKKMLSECGTWSKAIIASTMLGDTVYIDFIKYAYRLAMEKNPKATIVPNDIFELADKTFNWPINI